VSSRASVAQRVVVATGDDPLALACGRELAPVEVAYESYGELAPGGDNAIFVCHALTGDAHVAGLHSATSKKPGWWDDSESTPRGVLT